MISIINSCMSHLLKPVNIMESLDPPLLDGPILTKLNLSEPLVETIDIGSKIKLLLCLLNMIPGIHISMPESLLIDKRKIYNDKSLISLKNFPTPDWSKISGLDLDSIVRVFKDSLNLFLWEKYPLLLLHIKTVLAVLALNSLNGCAKEITRLSWLTMKILHFQLQEMSSLKTSLLSLIPSAVECMEIENSALKFPTKIKNKKIQMMNPTQETHYVSAKVILLSLDMNQKKYLSKLAFAYNLVYNAGIKLIQHKIKHMQPIDPSTFRDELLRGDHSFLTEYDLSNIPYRVKEKAAENVSSILKGFITKWNKYTIKKKKKRKKKKKKRNQCKYIYTRGISKGLQCINHCKTELCSTHKPKTYCNDNSKCKCMVFKNLKTCKKHASDSDLKSLLCDYINPKTQHACSSYHTGISSRCSKHNVNLVCIEKDCNNPSKGDYCFHHALKNGIQLKMRSRKNNKYFCLNQRDWSILQNRLGCFIDDAEGTIIDEPPGEMIFIYNRTRKEWKLIYTIYSEKPKLTSDDRKLLCSFDSGEKRPQTIYSFDDGQIIEVSSRFETEKYLTRLIDKIELYKSYKNSLKYMFNQDELKEKSKELRRINRMISKCQSKVSNRIKDAHWKLAHWICSNYKYVVLPNFNTSKKVMIRNGLSKSTRKNLLAWKHGQFMSIMKIVSARYNTFLITGPEFYTTKTCVECRRLTDIGNSDTFKCRFEDCKFEGPRDVCGAINNGLQYVC